MGVTSCSVKRFVAGCGRVCMKGDTGSGSRTRNMACALVRFDGLLRLGSLGVHLEPPPDCGLTEACSDHILRWASAGGSLSRNVG